MIATTTVVSVLIIQFSAMTAQDPHPLTPPRCLHDAVPTDPDKDSSLVSMGDVLTIAKPNACVIERREAFNDTIRQWLTRKGVE